MLARFLMTLLAQIDDGEVEQGDTMGLGTGPIAGTLGDRLLDVGAGSVQIARGQFQASQVIQDSGHLLRGRGITCLCQRLLEERTRACEVPVFCGGKRHHVQQPGADGLTS